MRSKSKEETSEGANGKERKYKKLDIRNFFLPPLISSILLSSCSIGFFKNEFYQKMKNSFSRRTFSKIPILKTFVKSELFKVDEAMKKFVDEKVSFTFYEEERAEIIYGSLINDMNLVYVQEKEIFQSPIELFHFNGFPVAVGEWKTQVTRAHSITSKKTVLKRVVDCFEVSSLFLSLCRAAKIEGKLAYKDLGDTWHFFSVIRVDGKETIVDPTLDLPIVSKNVFGVYEIIDENKPKFTKSGRRILKGFNISADTYGDIYSSFVILSDTEADSLLYFKMGIQEVRKASFDKAIEFFKKSLELNPENRLSIKALKLIRELNQIDSEMKNTNFRR